MDIGVIAALTFFLLLVLIWTWILYPLLLLLVGSLARPRHRIGNRFLPKVTVMIMTYNEAKTIGKKIENTLSLDYPKRLLEVFVVDSASDDGTQGIVRLFGGKVRLVEQGVRKGKGSAINFGIRKASGDIVIITDGNAMMGKDALRKLVRHFADPKVGGVCGRFMAKNLHGTSTAEGGSLYWRFERMLRTGESALDSSIHMSGEITAIRRSVFTPVDEGNLTEDFDMAIGIRKRGHRIVYEPEAMVYEPAPTNVRDLTTQKRRIVIGTWQTLIKHRSVLFNPRYGWYGMVILPTHKLFQVSTPFLLMVLLLLSAVGALMASAAFGVFLSLQLVGYALIATVTLLVRAGIGTDLKVFIVPHYIAAVNWICVLGFWDFISGRKRVTWTKIESSRDML
ncbi:glycosyltransferase [Candidatus Woesearchaeota archaeon]|nr:glycosyltransferase [Candidatus Woesearchaeota archaeon]